MKVFYGLILYRYLLVSRENFLLWCQEIELKNNATTNFCQNNLDRHLAEARNHGGRTGCTVGFSWRGARSFQDRRRRDPAMGSIVAPGFRTRLHAGIVL